MRTSDLEIRHCEYCGKPLERKRRPSGNLEYPCEYKKRKYCDIGCMKRDFLKMDNHEKLFGNAHTTARKINKLILGMDKCAVCGKAGRLDVHHIDGNWNNNDPKNLVALCRSCHNKVHRPKPTCKVERCSKQVKGYGYCEKHYQRFKKYGDPLLTNRGHGHIVRVED